MRLDGIKISLLSSTFSWSTNLLRIWQYENWRLFYILFPTYAQILPLKEWNDFAAFLLTETHGYSAPCVPIFSGQGNPIDTLLANPAIGTAGSTDSE